MDTVLIKENSRRQISSIVDTMSKEEMAWTIKYITDKMLVLSTNVSPSEEVRPSWWNRPLLASTRALFPKERVELGDDYQELLTDILEEKYL